MSGVIDGMFNTVEGFVVLAGHLLNQVTRILFSVKVPFFGITFYRLYLNIFWWTIGVMIFKAFFQVGLVDNGNGSYSLGGRIKVMEERKNDTFVGEYYSSGHHEVH